MLFLHGTHMSGDMERSPISPNLAQPLVQFQAHLEGLGSLAMPEGKPSLAPALQTSSLPPGRDEKAKSKAKCLAMRKNGYLRQRSAY